MDESYYQSKLSLQATMLNDLKNKLESVETRLRFAEERISYSNLLITQVLQNSNVIFASMFDIHPEDYAEFCARIYTVTRAEQMPYVRYLSVVQLAYEIKSRREEKDAAG